MGHKEILIDSKDPQEADKQLRKQLEKLGLKGMAAKAYVEHERAHRDAVPEKATNYGVVSGDGRFHGYTNFGKGLTKEENIEALLAPVTKGGALSEGDKQQLIEAVGYHKAMKMLEALLR